MPSILKAICSFVLGPRALKKQSVSTVLLRGKAGHHCSLQSRRAVARIRCLLAAYMAVPCYCLEAGQCRPWAAEGRTGCAFLAGTQVA